MMDGQNLEERNKYLVDVIKRTKIDTSYSYNMNKLLDEKTLYMKNQCAQVLDFGKSSRHRYDLFMDGQIETADINQFDNYPDHLCDICDFTTFPQKKYDGIICNAVIEHVYSPHKAVSNIYEALNDGGVCMCYAPFIFRYHAPDDLKFQDYFRFTRDGLAFLFQDFSNVTLYSSRGRASSAINFLYPRWKRLEKKLPFVSKMADFILGGKESPLQVSGYVVWAIK